MMLDWLADKHGLESATEPASASSARSTRSMRRHQADGIRRQQWHRGYREGSAGCALGRVVPVAGIEAHRSRDKSCHTRESGVSSTPRSIDPITIASEYWIVRFRGR